MRSSISRTGPLLRCKNARSLLLHGFAGVTIVESGGTIFPGLIELHNHLSYNALPLWSPVPKRFENRGQWPNHKDYRPLVSGPMTVIGQYKDATRSSFRSCRR